MLGVDGYRFSTDLRVRFSETDAQGVAHNSAYLVWLEIARIDYLARFPGGYRGLVEEHGIDVTTVESYVRYRAGCRFDDPLKIWARTTDVRGARFRFEYAIERVGEPHRNRGGGLDRACLRRRVDAQAHTDARLALGVPGFPRLTRRLVRGGLGVGATRLSLALGGRVRGRRAPAGAAGVRWRGGSPPGAVSSPRERSSAPPRTTSPRSCRT